MSMSADRRRKGITDKPQQSSQRQGVRANLPRTSLQENVRKSQQKIRNIKSPFASDQTKTISNRPNPNKKRKLGQIPLRDRQHDKIKVNQSSGQGIGQQVRKLAQNKPKGTGIGKKVRTLAQQQKKTVKKTNRPNQFTKKNKSRAEIDRVFNFNSNERSFF